MKKAAAFVLILAALCAVLTGCTAIAENWPFHTPVPGFVSPDGGTVLW